MAAVFLLTVCCVRLGLGLRLAALHYAGGLMLIVDVVRLITAWVCRTLLIPFGRIISVMVT